MALVTKNTLALFLLIVGTLLNPVQALEKSEDRRYGEIKPDEALVYVVRPGRYMGAIRKLYVLIDDKPLVVLGNKTYAFAYVEPGSHIIHTGNMVLGARQVYLAPGKAHYFDAWIAIQRIANQTGEKLTREYRYAIASSKEKRKAERMAAKKYKKALRRVQKAQKKALAKQVPVTEPGKRLNYDKFSVLPPQGANWFVLMSKEKRKGVFVLLGKQIDPNVRIGTRSFEPHTIRAKIQSSRTGSESIGSPQEFLDMIKQSEKANTSARFTVLKESYSLNEKVGEYCVNLDKLTEDRGVPVDPGTVYIFHYNSLSCWDRDNRLLVVIGCSQRAPDTKDMMDLKSECEPFINSLSFRRR